MKRTYFLTLVLAAALAGGCRGNDHDQAAAPPAGSAPVGTSGEAADVKRRRQGLRSRAPRSRAWPRWRCGRLALQRSSDANVKKFAQMMIDDHTKAVTLSRPWHRAITSTCPPQVDENHREKAEELGKKQRLDFDRDYADTMVDGHQAFVDKLESRVDKDTLAAWKAKNIDPATRQAIEAKGEAITIVPEKERQPGHVQPERVGGHDLSASRSLTCRPRRTCRRASSAARPRRSGHGSTSTPKAPPPAALWEL